MKHGENMISEFMYVYVYVYTLTFPEKTREIHEAFFSVLGYHD